MKKVIKKTSSLKMVKKSVKSAIKALEDKYTLPTEVSKPSDNIWDYGILIHAEKKIGKTSLCSMIPDCFFMMTQPGAKSFKLFQRPVKSWDAFKAYVMLLEKDKTFKRVVVDHADGAYKGCVRYICKREGWDHPDDGGGYGKGWAVVNEEFEHWTNRLLACGKGNILLSHSVYKDVKTRTGNEYSRIVPTLSGGAWAILEQNVDILIHLYYEGEKRMMQIVGNDQVSAGHNLEERFKYTDGTRIRKIPMGKSKQEAYENLMKAFNNQLERPKEKEVEKKKKFVPKKKIK